MQGLNIILGNRSQLIVLRTLYQASGPLTGRDVERRSGLSNRAAMVALDTLTELQAVYREDAGRAYHFSLNANHYLVRKALKPAFDAEELFWEDLSKSIRRVVRPRPFAAVATGPLVREETDYGGKLTLTMLFDTGRQRLKALMAMEKLADTMMDRYGIEAEHHLLDLNNMDLEEYDPIWRRVEREGILLFGNLP